MGAPAAAAVAATSATPGPAATARAWLDAVTARDLDRVGALLAPDVWFRVLLPRDVIQANRAAGVLGALHEWFVTPSAIQTTDAVHHTFAGREHVRYAFRLLPRWAPDGWHAIEQAGYLRIAEGRVRRVDLVCTGFHPLP